MFFPEGCEAWNNMFFSEFCARLATPLKFPKRSLAFFPQRGISGSQRWRLTFKKMDSSACQETAFLGVQILEGDRNETANLALRAIWVWEVYHVTRLF
jgi:hypothetical protein